MATEYNSTFKANKENKGQLNNCHRNAMQCKMRLNNDDYDDDEHQNNNEQHQNEAAEQQQQQQCS